MPDSSTEQIVAVVVPSSDKAATRETVPDPSVAKLIEMLGLYTDKLERICFEKRPDTSSSLENSSFRNLLSFALMSCTLVASVLATALTNWPTFIARLRASPAFGFVLVGAGCTTVLLIFALAVRIFARRTKRELELEEWRHRVDATAMALSRIVERASREHSARADRTAPSDLLALDLDIKLSEAEVAVKMARQMLDSLDPEFRGSAQLSMLRVLSSVDAPTERKKAPRVRFPE